ncbi:MAG: hypothetical protein JWP35_1261 [Caulobacter sp.]|nr:hypothetical protein [Caulobacter sp.]
MPPERLSFDVTAGVDPAIAGGPLRITARLFAPELPNGSVIVCLNGGTYDWRYWHAEIPGHPGYSMAEHLAALGHVVLLFDHLGIGDSSRPADAWRTTRQVAAAAAHAAATQAFAALEGGSLSPSLAPMTGFTRTGAGHSMGAMQTITQQAMFGSYDRIAVLGYTAIGVHLHVAGQVTAAHRELDPAAPAYWLADRAMLRKSFHWDDVPEPVLAADDALLVEVPYVLSTQSIQAGIVAEDAAKITCPVYICLGERDVSPDPHAEPALYAASPDVTLHILPHSGHCQNFAFTRQIMWDRIDRWVQSSGV